MIQSDQEPTYSAAGMPATCSASTSCAAVTPEPQYTPRAARPGRARIRDAQGGEPGAQRRRVEELPGRV